MNTDVLLIDERAMRWRCRRGMRELDVLLGGWLDNHWTGAPVGERMAFQRLTECEDDQIWSWIMGRGFPDDPDLQRMVELLRGRGPA